MDALVSPSPLEHAPATSRRLHRHTTDSVPSRADSIVSTRYRHVQDHSMTDKPNAIPSPWINVPEAAEYLDVCVDTIYDACAAGGLKHVRLGRRTIRLKREWLEAWVEAQARIAK